MKQFRCKDCNKRLFDYNPDTQGEIKIKCSRCGTMNKFGKEKKFKQNFVTN